MPIFKRVNEDNHCSYDTAKDVERLIHYIGNPKATASGSGALWVGFMPRLLFPSPFRTQDIVSFFHWNHSVYGKTCGNLMRHRVLSFSPDELPDLIPIQCLADQIAEFYYRLGFLCFYGIHLNTDNVHIHFAVDGVNYFDGSAFNHFYAEKELTRAIGIWCDVYKRSPIVFLDRILKWNIQSKAVPENSFAV